MKLFKIGIICSIILMTISCDKVNSSCREVTVICKIRDNGGGLAVALDKKYQKSVSWQGHQNVVELLNIPESFTDGGTTIYFSSRIATEEEKGLITTDGDETIDLVVYGTEFSDVGCQ
jgi:hypothetical protein